MNSPIRLAVAALLTGALTAPVAAVEFESTVIDPEGPALLWGKGAGDLNGDGKSDLVVGSKAGGLHWYENPGWTRRTISATTSIEEDIAVIDLDRDRRRNVVAVTNRSLTWFRSTASGWEEHVLVSGPNLHDLVVADLDGDGKLDLAARDQGNLGNVLYLWRQQGLESWEPKIIPLLSAGEGLSIADIDRDGRSDLVVSEYWLRNTGGPGNLSFRIFSYGTSAPMRSYLAVGDLNGDNRIDIVTAPAEPAGKFHQLSFEAPASPLGGKWIRHVVEGPVETATHFAGVADVDLDGDLDIATALTQKAQMPQIKLYLNQDGKGSFSLPQIIANTSSHSMKFVRVGTDAGPSLFGADYDMRFRTPVRLFRWKPDRRAR